VNDNGDLVIAFPGSKAWVAIFALWISGPTPSAIDNSGIWFSNPDAPVSFLDGTPVGAGFTAQLYAGLLGAPIGDFDALSPVTTFWTGPPELVGTVHAIAVRIPWALPGQEVAVVMRAFDGPSWEESMCRGESNPAFARLGTPLNPPRPPAGLQPFQVNCVPEPSALALVGAAGAVLLAFRYRQALAGRSLSTRRQP
jgi:hypothetical protein